MSGRLWRFFLADEVERRGEAPPDRRSDGAIQARPGAPRFVPPAPVGRQATGNVVALAAAADAAVVAGGLAAGLRGGGRLLVSCLWPPAAASVAALPAPAFPTATRVAQRLEWQGLMAEPVGLAAHVALDADPGKALAEARRAEAVAGGPIAVVLSRRAPELDVLIEEAAAVLLVGDGDADLTALALAELAGLRHGTRVVPRPASPVSRLQQRLGLAALEAQDPRGEPALQGSRTAEPV